MVGEAVLGEHQRRRAERVGLDDVGAGREVEARESAHHVRPGEAEVLVAALELRAAEVGGGQVEPWSAVPVAPSSTRMRSSSASSSAAVRASVSGRAPGIGTPEVVG